MTIRYIAKTVGINSRVRVIDVETQQELEEWTFVDLVEYFENPIRLRSVTTPTKQQQQTPEQQESPESSSLSSRRRRPRRQVVLKKQLAQAAAQPVLNQISYEFSFTPLASIVKSPQFVRDMDWIDHAWPDKWRKGGDHHVKKYPMVQYYVLTSAAGSYTHIDFGGTSVWYHIVSGCKEFCLIRPTPECTKRGCVMNTKINSFYPGTTATTTTKLLL